ncbi:uncharacterized protein LOC122512869 [Leptopilina heterotoma]|uniref:uncharacterized protein LOC122512869 n=1 Tax=Leptopilina heterotoma TaxID=63436 RepID=UPI001CA8504A|nr:uncharacterized protein LOC122512869 [Leptopilina heterotoma]
MQSTTSITLLTNNQFFSVCHYITTLGIILNNNNLLSTPAENDTVPVLNAFFEYLIKSDNESAAKIHLFKEIRNIINVSGYEEVKNFENVNKLYQYIINIGLFAHYGNITGYVSNIYQDNKNKSFSDLQEILFHDFSNNLTAKNICSLRKESENLNSLAIKRIFVEYVLPVFTKMWKGNENLNVQRNDLKIVKRFRRQESSSEDSDSGALVIDEDSPEEEDPLRKFRFNFLLKLKVQGLTILNQERDLFSNIVNIIALEQLRDGLNLPLELWLQEFTTNVSIANYLINLKGSTFITRDFMLVTSNPSGQVPPNLRNPQTHSQMNGINIFYYITSESLNGFVDLNQYNIHNLYILFPNINFTVTDVRYEEIENRLSVIIVLERNDLSTISWFNIIKTNERNSTRMNAIKRAAKFISLNGSMATYPEAVNRLKSYILSTDTDIHNLLTYDQLAQNYLQHMLNEDFYLPWKIDNSKYINDVLYESKFYFQPDFNHCYQELMKILKILSKSTLSYYYNMYRTDLNSLQKKFRFEDFYRIGYLLNKKRVERLSKFFKVAVLRLALRQCDEELNEEPIVLYQAFYVTDTPRNVYQYTGRFVTLGSAVPCSRNLNLLLSNVLNDTSGEEILFVFQIKINNRCRVADVYQFSRSEVKSHFLSTREHYERIEKVEVIIGNQKVIYITVKPIKEKTKEKQIIDIVKELNDIYMDGKKYYMEEY